MGKRAGSSRLVARNRQHCWFIDKGPQEPLGIGVSELMLVIVLLMFAHIDVLLGDIVILGEIVMLGDMVVDDDHECVEVTIGMWHSVVVSSMLWKMTSSISREST